MKLLNEIKEMLKTHKYVPVHTGSVAILVVAVIDDDDFPLMTSDGEQYSVEDWGHIIDLSQ